MSKQHIESESASVDAHRTGGSSFAGADSRASGYWGLGTGLEKLRRLVRNALIDARFGWPLAAVYLSRNRSQNSDYAMLEELFRGRIQPTDVLVDVGCGAGRVINHWLRVAPSSRIFGLELDPTLAARTRWRLRRRGNVSILTGDAVTMLPDDGTVFFLFNPFGEETMRRFAERVLELPGWFERNVVVLYFNCKHVHVFADDPAFDVRVHDHRFSAYDQDLAVIRRR